MCTKKNILLKYATILIMFMFSDIQSEDSGEWIQIITVPTDANEYIYSLHSMGNTLYAGTPGGVFKTNDAGVSWTTANNGLERANPKPGYSNYTDIISLHSMGNTLYAGTPEGVYKTSDEGASWILPNHDLPPVQALQSINGILFASTYDKGVFKSTDEGDSWINASLTNVTDIRSLQSIGNTLYAGAFGKAEPLKPSGGVFRTNNEGQSWTEINKELTSPEIIELRSMNDLLYTIVHRIGLFKTSDKENNWQDIGASEKAIYTLYTANDILYVETYNGQGGFKTTDKGDSWTSIGLTGESITALLLMNGALYASTDTGRVFKKNITPSPSPSWWDRNWKFVSIPLTIAGALGTVFGCYVNRKRLSLIKRIPGLLKQKRDAQNYQPLEKV